MTKTLKKSLAICVLFFVQNSFAQKSLFLKLGSNITQYQYTEITPKMRPESGGSYEVGFKKLIPESSYPGLYYSVSLLINNFNQSAGSSTSLYQWKATYMGLNGNVGFKIYNNRDNSFKGNLVFGTSISSLVKGTQTTNFSLYDLKSESDFNKIFITPSVGIEGIYNINNEMMISLGYNYSKSFNFKPNGTENLNFTNNNFFLGTYIEF